MNTKMTALCAALALSSLCTAAEPESQYIGYNPPSRPLAKEGYNLWVRSDALYWRATLDNLIYAYTNHNPSDTINRTVKSIQPSWDWGFRLGAGYAIPRDNWDLAFYWTHQSGSAKSHTTGKISPVWWLASVISDLSGITFASGRWSPELNQLDLSLGRDYYVGSFLTLRPNVGLRNTWIEQDIHIHYNIPSDEGNLRVWNNYWGFGFLGGLDTKWLITKDWHLFANGSYAIIYGNFDAGFSGHLDDNHLINVNKNFHAGRSILDLQAGFEWAHTFFKERIAFVFRAGYEYHLYPAQNQLPLPTGNNSFSNSFSTLDGDLAYQGLFLSGQFDF
ncbi:MAG: hypothetical protein K2P51_06365 [Rhabdochlamydiaceae bacterium]|nr:hypothetical protein [Rhabdochlamydiaceae bacterium]